MSDKRSVATDALETLGTAPLDEHQKRDAIHLAVEPVIAGCVLPPGMHVSITNGVAMPAIPGEGLGIVDPFLLRPVTKGERFWFVMLPRTIKSLRHVWAHPAFLDEVGTPAPDGEPEEVPPAIQTLRGLQTKERSERWLREFCASADCPSYETVMATIANGNPATWDDGYLHFSGSDAHGEIPAEFWDHAETVLGRKLEQRPTYFSCSC